MGSYVRFFQVLYIDRDEANTITLIILYHTFFSYILFYKFILLTNDRAP